MRKFLDLQSTDALLLAMVTARQWALVCASLGDQSDAA